MPTHTLTCAYTHAQCTETFHLLHILIDDYIIHFLESSLDGLQERMYHKKIDVLLKQGRLILKGK